MNIICLLDKPEVVIASGKRVFSAEETGALLSLTESADRLQASIDSEEARIKQAENDACQRGLEEGIAQGRQVAAAELAEKKLSLVDKANAELSQVREEVLSLALQVVKKIANEVAKEDLLYALANTAAQECLPSKSIVLKVHPDCVDGVKQRLSEQQESADTKLPIQRIVADEDLEMDACVLETDAGQVCADLETQLSVLEKHLTTTAVQPVASQVNDPVPANVASADVVSADVLSSDVPR